MVVRKRKKLEKLDREEAQQIPYDHHWPPPIEAPGLTDYFWQDPEPGRTGVLTGDRIRAYHYAVGRMIRPFQEEHLNPASYDLTLGPRCIVDGKEVVLDGTQRVLEIPPSSIALVTSREELFIPHWLVATFNLKSKYIFDGLLMGAGPQVDPGFIGVLSCPLHNISNRPVRLRFCMPFAKLDFVKTTWGGNVNLDKVTCEDDFYKQGDGGDIRSRDGEAVKTLPRPKSPRPAFIQEPDLGGGESSLRNLENELVQVRASLRNNKRLSYSVIVGLVTLVFTGVTLFFDYTDARYEDVRNDNAAVVRAELGTALEQRIKEIRQTAERTPLDGFE